MRLAYVAGVVVIAALGAASCNKKTDKAEAPATATKPPPQAEATPQAVPSAPPARKPGLWVQKISISDGDQTQTTRLCLDAASDAKLSMFGQQMSKKGCEKNEISRKLDGSYTFNSVCDMDTGGTTTTTGTATGDFSSKYHVVAQTSTAGADAPQLNGARTLTIDAEWTGPCPASFKPGDIEIAKGVKVNILAMNAKAAATGGR